MNTFSKFGVLVTNLGTPEAPTPTAVKKYLSEFLWDPFVVQIPRPLWWLILNGIVLRTRPKKSAKLYEKIWTAEGSPLLVFMQQLVKKLHVALNVKNIEVELALGMRYGEPSLAHALKNFKAKNITEIIALPLYPQYSYTTTASTLDAIKKHLHRLKWQPSVTEIKSYSHEKTYIYALANAINNHWEKYPQGQKLIFSFHGIPKKHIDQGDPYYEQCQTTAASVASLLNLTDDRWEIVFQSRFGREEWLSPYCDEVLQALPKRGCKSIDIVCPGFAVDCLETLEEIAITNRRIFTDAGGLIYNYIPALNDSDLHVQSLTDILLKNLPITQLFPLNQQE